jgi:hypothetical protein
MKTKTLLMICLLAGIGLMKVSAQDTRTYPFVVPIEGNDFELSIICDGVQVDVLNFPAYYDLRIREHYKNSEFKWFKAQLNNVQYTSKLTGEVFHAQDIENQYERGLFLWHMNLNGNMGNHYNIKMVFETTNWEMVYSHSTCH